VLPILEFACLLVIFEPDSKKSNLNIKTGKKIGYSTVMIYHISFSLTNLEIAMPVSKYTVKTAHK